MSHIWPSLLVGFVIPAILIIGGVLVLGPIDFSVGPFPLIFVWLFICFPLTSLCLWLSWHFFDRQHYSDEEG
jgi:hypothetical protein